MPKRKKRPWVSTDVLDASKARSSAKVTERKAREKAFREANPERFIEANPERFIEESARRARLATGAASSKALKDDSVRQHSNFAGETESSALDGRGKHQNKQRSDSRRSNHYFGGEDVSGVDVDPKTFPMHEPWQTRDGITSEEFERRRARVEAVTREIGTSARHKQLRKACHLFVRLIQSEGLVPTPYTYTSLLNAYVNTGTMDGAEALMARMWEVGCAPNVVSYTTLLKGYLLVANVDAAKHTLEGMKHPVLPDLRAINTYMRVCLRCGDLAKAIDAYGRMSEWDVVPDTSTFKLFGRLLAQGLKIDDVKKLIKSIKHGDQLKWTNDPRCGPCQFWRAGNCERGVNCRYYHDQTIAQRDAGERAIEQNDLFAHLHINCAHAMSITSDMKGCKKHIKKASEYLPKDDDDADVHTAIDGEHNKDERAKLYKATHRDELRLEVKRIESFADRVLSGAQPLPLLNEHFARTLIFSSRILQMPPRGTTMSSESVETLRSDLFAALQNTMGLSGKGESVRKSISKIIADDGTLRFDKMFGRKKNDARELNLEVAAGNGDWAVEQAKADVGADWISLELRHDRVYSIFSRAVCEGTSNFAAMGGDAAYVFRRHIKESSISNVFVNFPEPPHHSGDSQADNSLVLLTEDFFRDVHASLQNNGGLIIFSDNHRYMRTLARMLGDLGVFTARDADFSSGEVATPCETIAGVPLYEGVPGCKCGHRVFQQSYFDRFWENGQHNDRFFISVAARK